jgi:hypothetical protein
MTDDYEVRDLDRMWRLLETHDRNTRLRMVEWLRQRSNARGDTRAPSQDLKPLPSVAKREPGPIETARIAELEANDGAKETT